MYKKINVDVVQNLFPIFKYKHIKYSIWLFLEQLQRNITYYVYVKRFEVQYFTCGGSHATLTVDTRASEASGGSDAVTMETADIAATPLEKLIRSKLVLLKTLI